MQRRPHDEALHLTCDLDDGARQAPQELCRGLSGDAVLTDSDGRVLETVAINSDTVWYRGEDIVLTGFAPPPTGSYVVTVRVDSGAPALAGKKQSVYAKQYLCGLEQLLPLLAAATAVAAGIVGLVCAACVVPGLVRHGFWRVVALSPVSRRLGGRHVPRLIAALIHGTLPVDMLCSGIFIVDHGAPIEFLQFDRPESEIWPHGAKFRIV